MYEILSCCTIQMKRLRLYFHMSLFLKILPNEIRKFLSNFAFGTFSSERVNETFSQDQNQFSYNLRIVRFRFIVIIIFIALFSYEPLCYQGNRCGTNHCACYSNADSNCQAGGLGLVVKLSLERKQMIVKLLSLS